MKTFRIIIGAILAVALTAGVAGAQANAHDLTIRLEKWFHQDGDKIHDLRLHTVVRGGFDGTVVQEREVKRGDTVVSHNSFVFSRNGGGDVFFHGDLDGVVYEDPIVWVDAPLTVGKAWSDAAPLDPTGLIPGTVHYVFAVLEEAEIACPQGTFLCQRVYVATIRPDGTTSNCNYWYNASCGLIRCEMDDVGAFTLQKAQFIDGPEVPDVEIRDEATESDVSGLLSSPNPTAAGARIRFDLARSADVTVEIYDVAGRLVRTLVSGETRTAGPAAVAWDGRDGSGRTAAAGVYIARVRTARSVTDARLVLVR